MVSSTVRLRISRRVLKKLLGAPSPRPSMGLDEVLRGTVRRWRRMC